MRVPVGRRSLLSGGGNVGTIVEDLREAAESIAGIANDAGYGFDFSVQSLSDVERFIDDNASHGEPRPGGLLSKDLGSRVFALGAYVGEVIRGAIGGEWVADTAGDDWLRDGAPDADLAVSLKTPNGLLWPNQQVMKRIMNGAAESLMGYAAAAGVDVGVPPAS
jgi:hypothetical protein